MSETKWTPGPWEVHYDERNGRPLGVFAPGDKGIPGVVGHIVRDRGIGFPTSALARANARLIAAAPDLYEAAIKALAEMRNTVAPRSSFTDAVDALDAAITKAKGENHD